MAEDGVELSILFADVCGSTRLYERLGEQGGQAVIDACVSFMGEIVGAHGGRVVKVIGDEVMASFPAPLQAVRAACELQEEVEGGRTFGGQRLALRAAIHHGPALVDGPEVFGPVVDRAARLAGVARGAQVVVGDVAAALLPPELRDRTRTVDRLDVGDGHVEALELAWEPEDVTALGEVRERPAVPAPLRLRYGNTEVELPALESARCRIGRSAEADLVVDHRLASRRHCRIEFRSGEFVLVDESTNGTWVTTADGAMVHLRGEELAIWGEGLVGLGERTDVDPARAIGFRCP
jgi:class 3 adenylate cyclase